MDTLIWLALSGFGVVALLVLALLWRRPDPNHVFISDMLRLMEGQPPDVDQGSEPGHSEDLTPNEH